MALKDINNVPVRDIYNQARDLAIQDYDRLVENIGPIKAKRSSERTKETREKVLEAAVKEIITYAGEASTTISSYEYSTDNADMVVIKGRLPKKEYVQVSLADYLTNPEKEEYRALEIAAEHLKDAQAANTNVSPTEEDPKDGDETTKFIDAEPAQLLEKRFQEQCFLIDNFRQLVPLNYGNPYGKYFTCVSDDHHRVISKITGTGNMKPFLDLQPSQIASAHPQLRFFKINKTKKGPVQKEILFADYDKSTSINEYFSNDKGRHDGVGIKSFSWKFIGRSQVTVERNIECRLLLAFRNLEDLDPVGVDKSKYGTFLDILLYDPNKKEVNPYGVPIERWEPEKYEIQVMAGWSSPDIGNDLIPSALRKYLQSESVTMRLNLNSHAFNFKEDGSGTVEIGFQGVMDGHMEDANTDIFNLGPSFTKAIKAKRKKIERMEKDVAVEEEYVAAAQARAAERTGPALAGVAGALGLTPASDAEKRAKDLKGRIARQESYITDALAEQKTEKYQRLLKHLRNHSKIRFIDLDPEAINFMNEGQRTRKEAAIARKFGLDPKKKKAKTRRPKFTVMNEAGAVAKAKAAIDKATPKHKTKTPEEADNPEDKEAETNKGKEKELEANVSDAQSMLQPKNSAHHRITFFYLGDLLEAAFSMIKNLSGEELAHSKGSMRFLLGDITFVDPMDGKIVIVNLADIPISLILFLEWYNNKAVKPMLSSWPIRSFIHDVVHDLVLAALSPSCFSGYPIRPKMYMTHCEGPGFKGGLKVDRVPSRVRVTANNIVKAPPIRVAGKTIPSRMFAYTYIYAHNAPSSTLGNNPAEDARNGIYHFHVGKDRGLLKSITYSKEDAPGIKEARSEMEGIEPTSAQLREVYRVNIKAVGSTMFRPGQYVFVSPRVSGNKARRRNSLTMKLGMAGYVLLETVENIIKPGVFETILEGVNDGIVGGQFGAKIIKPERLSAYQPTVEERTKVPMTAEDGTTLGVPSVEGTPAELGPGIAKNIEDAKRRDEAAKEEQIKAVTEAQLAERRRQELAAVYAADDAELTSQPQ